MAKTTENSPLAYYLPPKKPSTLDSFGGAGKAPARSANIFAARIDHTWYLEAITKLWLVVAALMSLLLTTTIHLVFAKARLHQDRHFLANICAVARLLKHNINGGRWFVVIARACPDNIVTSSKYDF